MESASDRFFEKSAELIVVVAPDDRGVPVISRANPAVGRVLGWTEAALRGKPFAELIQPSDRDAMAAAIGELAGDGCAELTARCLTERGEDDVAVKWRIHRDSADGSLCAFGRERSVDEELYHDAERLFSLSADLMAVVDMNGHFTRLNPAWTKILGWSEEHLLSTPFLEFIHPDDIEPSVAVYTAGNSIPGQEPSMILFENRYRTADGTYRWLQWTGTRQDGADKSYAVARDVTALKELEKDLAEAETQARDASARIEETEHIYRQILDSLEDMVLVKGDDSRLLWGNSAYLRFHNITREELEESLGAASDGSDRHRVDDLQVWRTREPLHVPEEAVTRHDGAVVYFETVQSPIFDASDEVKMVVGVSRDLTRRREAEELRRSKARADEARRIAEAANRSKSLFLANMSHELRTPLNSVLGYAQVLEQTSGLDDRQRRSVETIRRSGEYLLTLISDILDLSKIEAGKLALSVREFHVGDFFASIVEASEDRAKQKRLLFSFRPIGDLPVALRADETRLRQVLLNLLVNAIKFTDAGTVALEVTYTGSELRCEVQDTGIGIAATELGTIFEPFEQIRRGTSPLEGTGLGLPISSELIKMMGGTLEVASEPGQGSRFWFSIPAVATAGSAVARAVLRPVAGYEGPRRKLLIVDDKHENRQALAMLLDRLGFELVEAEDGNAAVHAAAADQPDLIFMDLVMPALDGFEATRRIRANPATADIPIIAISASVFDNVSDRSQAAGCNDFIAKPFDASRVFAVLAERLRLTWIYHDPPEAPARPEAAPDTADGSDPGLARPAPPATLPREVLIRLQEAARVGDVQGVLAALAGHVTSTGDAAEDTEAHRFAAELHGLARRFQLRRIEDLLERLLTDG